MQQESDRDEIFGPLSPGTYLWCLHCQRTYEHGKWRQEGKFQMCPYADCDGDAVIDAWEWTMFRENHPDYPETPVFGARYPMNAE